jgi:hypothetical protein
MSKKPLNGKPPRVKGGKTPRTPQTVLLAKAAATLPPLASAGRCTALQAQLFLSVSLPTIYQMIKAGELDSYIEDGHRYITGASIRRRALPPSQRPPVSKPEAFAPIRPPPNPRTSVPA